MNYTNNTSDKKVLNSLKYEVASELGISNYDNLDKGQLTSRQNGYIGGIMTKKLVELGKQSMYKNM